MEILLNKTPSVNIITKSWGVLGAFWVTSRLLFVKINGQRWDFNYLKIGWMCVF